MSAMSKMPHRSEFVTALSCDVCEETKCPDRISDWGEREKD